MDLAVLGWPDDGPTLDLDHRRFAYAGKFVMPTTGKAVARDRGDDGDGEGDVEGDGNGDDAGAVLGAVAFDADRTDPDVLRLRYVTVRDDRRGEGIGPHLCSFVARRGRERGFDRARIAVNNPFAYEALYKAGFAYTGERTGLAELVLERPGGRDPAAYREGLAAYRERDLDPAAAAFVAERVEGTPPPRIEGVSGSDDNGEGRPGGQEADAGS